MLQSNDLRVVLRHIIIQIIRKQNALLAIFTLDETLHLNPEANHPELYLI
jgi:hypothetical protein